MPKTIAAKTPATTVEAKCPGVFCAMSRPRIRTCLAIERTKTHTTYITLATLETEKVDNKAFDETWKFESDYPVQRYVTLLVEGPRKTPVPKATASLLKKIAASAAKYQPFTQPKKEAEMPKSNAIATTAKTLSGKPTAAGATAKKAAAPAKAAAKPTPAAPAKTAAAKPAAKAAAPAKTAAPAKQPAVKAAAKPAGGAANKVAGDVKHKVADDSKVKRGFLREYVDAAKAKKVFTRDDLTAQFKGKETDERLVRYFYYATSNGIFVPAK